MRDLRSRRRIRLLRHGRIFDQTEIEDLRRAVAGDHQVFGFEIAVHQSRGMRGCQSICDTDCDRKNFFRRDWPAINQIAKRLTANQLHHQPRFAVLRCEIVDRDDVSVIERGGAARFAFESREAIAIVAQIVR